MGDVVIEEPYYRERVDLKMSKQIGCGSTAAQY